MFRAKCPNCNQVVEVKLGHCTNCDFNISDFMREIGFCEGNQLKTGYLRICPKCGLLTSNDEEIFYCRNCNSILKQTNEKISDFNKIIWDKYNYNPTLAERDYINEYVKDTLDFNLYSERIEEREKRERETKQAIERTRQKKAEEQRKREALHPQPKCPTCGSTDIKKIHSVAKAAGAVGFGLFSKTARSQFQCKNCGYKW
jgi:RNA polymerase subunit RPABC4/transcription elongation factor Spt4